MVKTGWNPGPKKVRALYHHTTACIRGNAYIGRQLLMEEGRTTFLAYILLRTDSAEYREGKVKENP